MTPLCALAPGGGDRWRLPARLEDPTVGADVPYGPAGDHPVALRDGAND